MTREQLLEKLATYKEKFCGYQGWGKIGLVGQRPTEKRLDIYKLKQILTKDSVVLDIGCNIGCLTMQIAEYVKEAYGVDDASYLIEQANLIKDFLQLQNVKFNCSNMFSCKFDVKFDVILYLAADFANPIEFYQYAQYLRSMLNEKGYLVFESHVMPEHKQQFDC
jgi:2-polyprenyl-3-methyl-5-hydroxy-6-metoxy-1,4-benzoquinol methylase